MQLSKPFSLTARKQSFKYAFEGIRSFFKTQPNALIHLFFTVAIFTVILLIRVPAYEVVILVLVIGFVWVAEIFNTAIEAIMDHLSPEKHPSVKFIKDVSAAAVLVACLTAVAAGLFIFLPKLLNYVTLTL